MKNINKYEELNVANNTNSLDELRVLYLKLIHKYSLLVKELSYDNAISYMEVIKILTINGFFSLGKFYQQMPYNDDFSKYYYGMNIINGYGLCRHTTDLAKRILDELNVTNYKYYCYLTKDKHLNPFKEYQTNHVANLVKYHDQLFLFDIDNDIVGSFKNKEVIKEINNNGIYFYHIPIDNINIDKMSYEEVKELLKVIKESLKIKKKFIRNYDNDLIDIEIKYTNEVINSKVCLSLINDFLYDTLEDKNEIVKRIGEFSNANKS